MDISFLTLWTRSINEIKGMLRNLNTSASYKIGRREQSLSSLLFFFAKLLHAKPKEASHEKRERKPVCSSRLCSNNVVVCNCAG